MKKLLLLLAVIALGFSAQADMISLQNANQRHVKKTQTVNPAVSQSVAEAMQANQRMNVITTQPEGELRTYARTGGQGIFPNQDQLGLDVQSGKIDMVFAEDNVVYLKNILFNCNVNFGSSWVQGTLSEDGTTITVPMGQPVYEDYYSGAEVVLCMGRTELVYVDGLPSIEFTVDESVTEVTYTIDGDNITLNGTEGSDAVGQDMNRWNAYGLSCRWTDDGSFGGCLEWHTLLVRTETTVIPTVISSQPEGEMVTYNRAGMSIFTGYFGVQSSPFADKMNMVYGTDGKVYIQNPLWWNKSYNTWVCGDYDPETGIISVPVGQYLQYNEDVEYGVQLLWGHSILYQDAEGYYMYEYFIDDVDVIQYKIDGENLYLLGIGITLAAE